jgi:peptidoglycan/xylan/chitin deacetylase (PgdA/CDA1 family)
MIKRIFNLCVSFSLAAVDRIRDAGKRLVGMKPRARCVVLAYHAVSAEERSRFAWQMDVLIKKAKPLRADIDELPEKSGDYAVVTFDDGLENIIENALPELAKRSIPATLFIVTDCFGRNRDWEHRGGDDTRHEKVMTAEQLKAIASDSIAVGSHSMTHPLMTNIPEDRLKQELLGSREKLEKLLNRQVSLFSFPYGGFNEQTVSASRLAGYKRVFTALPVYACSVPNEFETGRVGTAPTDWPLEYRLKLAGAYRWLPYAYSLKKRVRGVLGGAQAKSVKADSTEERAA